MSTTRSLARRCATAMLLVLLVGCSSSGDDGASQTTRASTTTTEAPVSLGRPLADQTPPKQTNGVAFDRDGRMWIADLTGGQLIAVDPADGSILVRLGADAGVRTPDDLAFDAEGRLWWTEYVAGKVGRIDQPLDADPTSVTVAEIGAGANPIAIADDGDVYVAQAQLGDGLYRLDAADPGKPEVVDDAPGQLNAFAFGEDGKLYSPRFVDGDGRVSAIDPDTGEATDLTDGLPLTVSVRVAPDRTLRVLTVGPGMVWTLDPETGERTELAELPSGAGDNMAFDTDGDLWVTSFDQSVVWRVSPDGEVDTIQIGKP